MRFTSLLTVAAFGAVTAGVASRVRANYSRVQRVPPHLRSPLLYLLPSRSSASPPKRSPLGPIVDRLVPRGLGEQVMLPSREGAPPVAAYTYEAPNRARPSGAVLWIHGGGMISGSAAMDHALCSRLARELGIFVLSVDYRLAPEDPFPAGPEDCFTAFAWLHEHADELGIDDSRLAVGGESAGGGLAAMVSQMAADRGLPVAFQVLDYPMLDDRTVLRADHEGRGELLWTPEHNASAWEWFLGHPATEHEPRPYAAAARRADLGGLAPAWIGVGDLDLFYLECVDYARRLEEAGVAVELDVVPGMPHALDAIIWNPTMKQYRAGMVAALARAVATPRADALPGG